MGVEQLVPLCYIWEIAIEKLAPLPWMPTSQIEHICTDKSHRSNTIQLQRLTLFTLLVITLLIMQNVKYAT